MPLLQACEDEVEDKVAIFRPVRAMEIPTAAALDESPWPGRAKASLETDLAFEVSGQVIERYVAVGEDVQVGQLLAKLDARDFENDLAAAEARRDRAKALMERVQQAARAGAVAQQEVTDAIAQFEVAVAEVEIRRKALNDTFLRAPFNGTVAFRYVDNFDNIKAKQPVIRLVDTSQIEFIVNIPETLISLVPYSRDLEVEFDAFPGVKVPAELKEIAKEASRTTRTFAVTLIMDQPEGIRILPGMAGRATGESDAPEGSVATGVIVPVTAVFSPKAGMGSFVWVIDEQTETVSQRSVQTGPLSESGVAVMDGLKYGEWIATAGVHKLEEGQRVRLDRREDS